MNPVDVPAISLLLTGREAAAMLAAAETMLSMVEEHTPRGPSAAALETMLVPLRSARDRLATIVLHRRGPGQRH